MISIRSSRQVSSSESSIHWVSFDMSSLVVILESIDWEPAWFRTWFSWASLFWDSRLWIPPGIRRKLLPSSGKVLMHETLACDEDYPWLTFPGSLYTALECEWETLKIAWGSKLSPLYELLATPVIIYPLLSLFAPWDKVLLPDIKWTGSCATAGKSLTW